MFSFDDFLLNWLDGIPFICRKPVIRSYLKLLYDAGISDSLIVSISYLESHVGNEPKDGYDTRLLIENTRNKLVAYSVSSLAALKTHHIHTDNKKTIYFLQLSVFIALFSSKEVANSSTTIMEAARNIRRLIVNPPRDLLHVPSGLDFLDTIEYIAGINLSKNNLSLSYLKEVKRGWSVFTSLKGNTRTEIIPPRRKLSHNHNHPQPLPFPFPGNDLSVEDIDESEHMKLSGDSVAPVRVAQRNVFRNQIIKTREQFGLLLCPVRFAYIESRALQEWFQSTPSSPSSILVVLSVLTSLKLHEIMGIHCVSSTFSASQIMSDNNSYGVIDLEAACYWRKELDIQNGFKPKSEQAVWLNNHDQWLALPIPIAFHTMLKNIFITLEDGTVEKCLELKDEKQANDLLTAACQEIRIFGGLNRPVSRRALRYTFFACIADQFGQHIASLILANNEFSNSTRHYYMSAKADYLQDIYCLSVNPFLPIERDKSSFPQQLNYVGSYLSISRKKFTETLTARIGLLNNQLASVKNEKDPLKLRETYNFLVAYTVTLFICATCHRRHNSIFIEHSCWNNDFTNVLIGDKLFFGESATRVIPSPEILTEQISNTKGWIEQIANRLKATKNEFSNKLFSSLSRKANVPFLGIWTEEDTLISAETSQVKTFLGEDWNLPQNALRQFFYQCLLEQPEAAKFLDHQMGHVSNALHPFQNTSFRTLQDEEHKEHRKIIQKSLQVLGFVNLKRTKTTFASNISDTYFLPETINGHGNTTNQNLAKEAITDVMSKVSTSSENIYSLLREKLADSPRVYEMAIKQLDNLLVDENGLQLNDSDFETLLKGTYFKSPNVKTVYPYEMHIAEHSYSEIYAEFTDLVKVIFSSEVSLDIEQLKVTLLMSLILDGEESIKVDFKGKNDQSVIIDDMAYIGGYLTGLINSVPIVFGGLTSILVALLVNHQAEKTKVTLNLKQLDRYMNSNYHHKKRRQQFSQFRRLYAVVCKEYNHSKWSFKRLFKHLDMTPRTGESGILFGLRRNTVKTKRLTQHAFSRLIFPDLYFHLSDSTTTEIKQYQHIDKQKYKRSHEASYYKGFLRDLPKTLDNTPNNSREGLRNYWNSLINDGLSSTKITELINRSNGLPEIVVLILTWLLEASIRIGQRDNGLAVSTIKNYLSTIAPSLCELCVNKSLLLLDYDDLLELYQNVIDMGDATHGKTRLKRLMDFHAECGRYFNLPKIDWRDLDVEQVEENLTGNLITVEEYNRAWQLIEKDKCLIASERDACLIVLIINYRLGLRRNETRRLRANDWCEVSTLCTVRSNRFGHTKSINGNRRIPYEVTMIEREYSLVKAFFDKARKQGDNPPIFYDPLFPSRIRSMDKVFNRVTEALQLVTGDGNTRLYDCRHSFINFTSTALILTDAQSDPIALAIKRWLPCKTFAEFQDNFTKATIGNPSTRNALLPALALMVGHSSATTTICNYIHLTHYWRWLSLEGELRAMKSLDSPIRNLVSMEKSQFSRKKHKSGLSAAYVVLGDLISADEKTELLKMEGTTFPDLALSDIRPNTLLGQFETIKHIERSLRVLEYMSSQTESVKIDLNSESSAYVIEKSDAEIAFIEGVWKAYQKILVKNVSYRAFSISAISYGIELPSSYRPKAAESYLSKAEFWDCCSALLSLPDIFLERLICLWETAWDATDRVCKVPVDEQQEWLTILATLSWQSCFSENSQPRLVNRSARLQCHELREVRTARNSEVSMLQFSHGLFLIILMREITE